MIKYKQINYKNFETETDLVETFISSISKEQADVLQIILREVDCWQGRADVVKAIIKSDRSILNFEQTSVLRNYACANMISLLHKKAPRSKSFLQKYMGLSNATINKCIGQLSKVGIIQQTLTGTYVINESFSLPKVELWAYEAKLTNWKRALYQASQYKAFSNYSYVVMPKEGIEPAIKNIKAFKINNIGLIQVEESGLYKIIYKPIKIKPRKKSYNIIGIAQVLQELEKKTIH